MTAMPQYFGFFGNGYLGFADAVEIGRGYSNLAWHNAEDPDLRAKLARDRVLGMRAIVAVQLLIYDPPSTEFRQDASVRLKSWFDGLWPEDQETIVALLIFDEPYRQNERWVHLDAGVVTAYLNAGSEMVARITKLKSMVSGSGSEFDQYGFPKLVDWIGMYRYSYNTSAYQLIYSFYNLLWRRRSEQKIVAIVDSYWPVDPKKIFVDQSRIVRFNGVWKWLVASVGESVIGVAPFTYRDSRMWFGAESMPKVLADLRAWGLKIVGRAS